MVLFNPPMDDARETSRYVERKLCRTVTWPQSRTAAPCLHADTVTAITGQCFKLGAGESLNEFGRLQRTSKCLPLMFDKVEINGFGVGDGITKFQDETYYGKASRNFVQAATPSSSSFCGRLALATLPRFQTARYSVISPDFGTAVVEALGRDTEPTWKECLSVKQTNCRKLYFCWEKAMRRMCALNWRCCGGDSKSALPVHDACRKNPNQGHCPEAMRTLSGSP